jgi:hypothetical protein
MADAQNPDQQPEGINRRRVALILVGLPVFFALFKHLSLDFLNSTG